MPEPRTESVDTQARSGQRVRSERHVIAYLASLGMLLAFGIDAALPAFDELRTAFGLEAGSNRITLVVTLYFVGMAVGQLFYGPLADRFGRLRATHLGLFLYSLGAVGSIFAPNLALLFVSRLVWGFGAAAPASLRPTIARDLYEGDQMARVISLMMAVFMVGPVLAPAIGAGILSIGSWEWIFGVSVLLALLMFVWSLRFGETLDPANQRPLDVSKIAEGFRTVVTTPSTRWYTLALMFGNGSFIIFLGSSQPIIDNIYGRDDQFPLWFGVAGAVMASAFFGVNRFIDRHGAHVVAQSVAIIALTVAGALLVIALFTDGVPAFGVWFVFTIVASAFTTLLTPTCYSLGLEPMGELAGTASGVMGFVATAGGAGLAAIVDASITNTITPMPVGNVVYLSLALFALVMARRSPVPV